MQKIEATEKQMTWGRIKGWVLFALTIFLWTSCSEEQLFPGNARLKTAFRLTSPHALGGSVTIEEAYLKLEGITITGTLGDQNAPEANYPIPAEDPPFRLSQADTARVSITLPTGAYDLMDIHLFLMQSDYKLIVHQKSPEESPPPTNNDTEPPAGGATDQPNENGSGVTDGGSQNGDGGDNSGGGEDTGSGGDEGSDSNGDDNGNSEGEGPDNSDPDTGENNNGDDGDRDDDEDGNDNPEDGDDKGKHDEDKDNEKKDKKKKKKNDDDDDDDDEREDDDERDDDRDDDDNDRTVANQVAGPVDLDHFFQHAKPSLVVFGTWSFNGQNVNIVFAVTDVERIMLRATQNGGHAILVDEHGKGTVNFDPERWFQSISTTDLQKATLQTYQGQPVMFIHKDVNSALFQTFLNNLTESTTFEVAAAFDQ